MVDPGEVKIGSGTIGAICGLSRFKTPMDVWNELMGLSPPSSSEQIDIGNALELPIAQLAAKRAGLGQFSKAATHFHKSEAFARATPDFFLPEKSDALLETKSVGLSPGPSGPLDDWRKDHDLVVPEYVQTQVQWQLEVVDGPSDAYVGALLAGREIFVARIVRDRDLGADLLDIARAWREKHILTGSPPGDADGSEGYSRYLAGRFPKSSGEWLVATPDDERMLEWYRRCQAARAQAETQEALAKQKLQERIGGALGILGACGKVSWAERRAYDVKAHTVAASRRLSARWNDDEG